MLQRSTPLVQVGLCCECVAVRVAVGVAVCFAVGVAVCVAVGVATKYTSCIGMG